MKTSWERGFRKIRVAVDMEAASLEGSSINRSGSFRKRPLEPRRSDGTEGLPPKQSERSSPTDMDITFTSKQSVVGPEQQIQDEVEQHFLRSLAQVRSQQPVPVPQVQGSSPLPAALQPPASSNEQQNHTSSHHSSIPQPSQLHQTSQSHHHPHHHHSHHHKQHRQQPSQPSPQPQPRTILPKPFLPDTHKIQIAENPIPSVPPHPPQAVMLPTTTALSSQSVMSTQSQLPKPSVLAAPTQQILIKTSQGPQIISSAAGGVVVSAATQGMQIIDLTQSHGRKFATSNGTSLQKVVPAAPAMQSSLASVSQVPNVINISQGNVLQVGKAPVVAVSSVAGGRLAGVTGSVVSGGVAKMVTTAGGLIQSPRKLGTTTTFTTASPSLLTPQVTKPAILTPQQPSVTIPSQPATPSMVPIIDPTTAASQLVTTDGQQLILLPGNVPLTLPNLSNLSNLSGQPFVLVNPSDLNLQQAAVATTANQLPTTSFINPMGGVIPGVNPGGYIVLHPGAFPSTAPIVNLAGGGAASTEQQQQQQLAGLAAAHTFTQSATPAPAPTPLTSTKTTPSRTHPPPKANPYRRVTRETSPDNIMTPATVEDHFAKALGEQWSQLKNNHSQAIVGQSTVAS